MNRIVSVYGLSRTVVPHLLQANCRLTPLRAHHKQLLVAPTCQGFHYYSLIMIVGLQSGKPVCVPFVLNTCGESSSGAFGVGRRPTSRRTNFSTQNSFSQNDFSTQNNFSQNNFSTQNNFSQKNFSQNNFSFASRRRPRTCTSQKGFFTQKWRESVLLRIIEILRLSDLIYPQTNR